MLPHRAAHCLPSRKSAYLAHKLPAHLASRRASARSRAADPVLRGCLRRQLVLMRKVWWQLLQFLPRVWKFAFKPSRSLVLSCAALMSAANLAILALKSSIFCQIAEAAVVLCPVFEQSGNSVGICLASSAKAA